MPDAPPWTSIWSSILKRVNCAAAEEAATHRSLFNVIDLASGWKVDLILQKEREFSRVEFERRTLVDIRRQ